MEKKGPPPNFAGQPVGPPPEYQEHPQQPAAYPRQGYPTQANTAPPPYNPQPMAAGSFDTGARFDGVSKPNIPPPPPGVMPNAAQMAASQGQNVVMQQKKGGFVEGSGDGAGHFWI